MSDGAPGGVRPAQATGAYVGAFVDELARAGVRHVVIAPGSRSAPLAIMTSRHPRLRSWVHLDERSAAFFALGLAKATGTPVALVCTSGTAGANFYPAVVEARAGRVPLVVITADRPPELRDVGAPQTIDQNQLYGPHVKWFVEMALPEATPPLLRYARTLACRLVATAAAAPAGPVHLNAPLREPLVPEPMAPPVGPEHADGDAWHGRADGGPFARIAQPPRRADDATIAAVAHALLAARRPLVVCGPQGDDGLAEPLGRLAALLGAPLLADPLSRLRGGTHDRTAVVDAYDALLRDEPAAARLAPDLVLRVGATPTSKALLLWLQRHASVPQILLDGDGWPDPTLVATHAVQADARGTCEALLAALGDGENAEGAATADGAELGDRASRSAASAPSASSAFLPAERRAPSAEGRRWLAAWQDADRCARAAIAGRLAASDEPFEGRALAELAELLPDGATLWVSSSMPVRDADAFFGGGARRVRLLANRGANGIDGVVSSAFGAAAAGDGPVVLAIGDLALYHDMNGLLAGRLHGLPLTIVLLNNDGGGIFSFLPQATQTSPAEFERLFGTPHGLDFAHAAALHGAAFRRAESWAAFREAVATGVAGDGVSIVELRTDRTRNVELHRETWRAVAEAVGGAMAP